MNIGGTMQMCFNADRPNQNAGIVERIITLNSTKTKALFPRRYNNTEGTETSKSDHANVL